MFLQRSLNLLKIKTNLINFRNGRPTEGIAAATQKVVLDVDNKSDEPASFLDLFRTPKLRVRTIAICFNWFVCGLCFFGVSQYMSHISGDIFTNVAISAAIQVFFQLFIYWRFNSFIKSILFSRHWMQAVQGQGSKVLLEIYRKGLCPDVLRLKWLWWWLRACSRFYFLIFRFFQDISL